MAVISARRAGSSSADNEQAMGGSDGIKVSRGRGDYCSPSTHLEVKGSGMRDRLLAIGEVAGRVGLDTSAIRYCASVGVRLTPNGSPGTEWEPCRATFRRATRCRP